MRLLNNKESWVFSSFSVGSLYPPVPFISYVSHTVIEDFLYLSKNAKALGKKAYQEFLEIENIVEELDVLEIKDFK